MTASPPPTRPVRLLTVCTGNICRSPYSALLLQDRFDEVRPGAFEVTSGGTHALVGSRIDPGSGALLERIGIDSTPFRATLMTQRTLAKADLVLVMNAEHRTHVVDEAPAMFRRVFLLRELAHLLVVLAEQEPWVERFARHGVALDPLSRWRALPDVLHQDARDVPRRTKDQDVTDPYRKSSRVFAKMAAELDPACDVLGSWEAHFPAG